VVVLEDYSSVFFNWYPTWYHRAQLQQSVSGHTNAFSTGFLIERSGTPDTVTRGGLIKSGHT
jgi:hypothetical protein